MQLIDNYIQLYFLLLCFLQALFHFTKLYNLIKQTIVLKIVLIHMCFFYDLCTNNCNQNMGIYLTLRYRYKIPYNIFI